MCYRFVLEQIEKMQGELQVDEIIDYTERPRYNIALTQTIPVLYTQERKRIVRGMRWGLIPSWAKDPAIGAKLGNARSETAAQKPSFRGPFRRQRSLIPADGFYEWQEIRRTVKQPYLIRRRDRRLFTIAGLYDRWASPEGETIWSVTLLTTTPNELIAPLHNRMPVIIPQPKQTHWLNPQTPPEELSALFTPRTADDWEIIPVSSHVNQVRHDDPRCLQPLPE
ncbi:MAG: putative SOS response-associated peptidase YedK [Phycisphaerae bacterium]|nr:putative SOS response-associated peptidase YedK [Phycisphaerae bacterium]